MAYLDRPPESPLTRAGSPPAPPPTPRPAPRRVNTLLPELINYLTTRSPRGDVLEIIDLGAGTGANQRWLAPRLPFQQRWIHLDHDPRSVDQWPFPQNTVIIDGSVEALDRLLATSPAIIAARHLLRLAGCSDDRPDRLLCAEP